MGMKNHPLLKLFSEPFPLKSTLIPLPFPFPFLSSLTFSLFNLIRVDDQENVVHLSSIPDFPMVLALSMGSILRPHPAILHHHLADHLFPSIRARHDDDDDDDDDDAHLMF
jgi:hypothetical protein